MAVTYVTCSGTFQGLNFKDAIMANLVVPSVLMECRCLCGRSYIAIGARGLA